MATYTSQYPPEQSGTYVKATTHYDANKFPYFATDPALSVTGMAWQNSWETAASSHRDQRFHIDLGSIKIIKRIYYENYHDWGSSPERGIKNFTFWGSNDADDFADLVYVNDGNWTELTVAQNTFDEHVLADQADPKYITVTNTTAYRYYAFKFADTRTTYPIMGVRRIELQIEEVPRKNVIQALLEGIWDKYDGSALESEINGMFFTYSPQGTAYPYGVYHLISNVPSWTFDADMENYIIQFNLYSE